MTWFRKQRELSELLNDPDLPFHFGRLMGASEIVGHWLEIQSDEELQQMGRRLLAITGWFHEPSDRWDKVTLPPAVEEPPA